MSFKLPRFLLFFIPFISTFALSQVPINVQLQFNGSGATALQASIGGASHNVVPGDVPYAIGTGGPVGNYMSLDLAANSTGMTAGTVSWTNQATIQCIFRPGRNFQVRVNGVYSGIIPLIQAGGLAINFQYPYVILNTNYNADLDYIPLEGVNKASWRNLQDGGWHMITMTVNGVTGQKRLYIDGQSPSEFITSGPTGNIQNSDPNIYLVPNGNLNRMYAGDIDEVNVYNGVLSPNQVWQNYQEFLAGQHFTATLAAAVPAYQATTAAFDPLEYPAGYTSGGFATATPINQMMAMPKPRAKPILIAADSMPPLLEAADFYYMGGATQAGISGAQAVLNGVEISKYWATWFNGALTFNQIGNQDPADTNTWAGKIVKVKNANNQLPLTGSTYMAQQPDQNVPFNAFNYCVLGEFPLSYYIQNSAGRAFDENGNLCPNWPPPFSSGGGNNSCGCGIGRQSRPTSPTNQASGYPWAGMLVPGNNINTYMTAIDGALTGSNKIDWLWENREVFHLITSAALAMDPVVEADRIAYGLNSRDYQSQHVAGCEGVYFGSFINSVPATTGTKVLGYQVDEQSGYFFNFQYLKVNYAQYHSKYLASTDDYPRIVSRWWQGASADHGLNWKRATFQLRFAGLDTNCIDFVSAGWDNLDEKNLSPVQWLGYLKILGAWGNISYITSIFSNIPNGQTAVPNPKNYIGTVLAVPSYAHAINTRLERFMNNGVLLPGDIMNEPVTSTYPAFQYNTGDFRALCVVRKRPLVNQYAIVTNLNRNANMVGNTEDSVVRSITLAGQTLTMTIREQGSVYVYDNTNPASPVFYQIDGWHEDKHPTRWSSDFIYQAEVNDNYDPQQPVTYKTYLRSGASPGDYVNSTTAVSYSGAVLDSVRFNGVPTVTGTYYGWVRARSKTGAATSVKVRMNTGAVVTLPVSSTQWAFYRWDNGVVSGPGINWSLTADVTFHLSFIATDNNIEVDQIILTKTPNAGYPEITSPCTVTSTITPSGATSFCPGGSVTLTSLPSVSYLWSTGATTQAINTTVSGSYVVTITDGSGCTGVSAATVVTVYPATATPIISAGGPTTFCSGGSVTLTSSASTTYLWSTGATTQAISPTIAGSYRVTVTDANGCTASSAVTTVTVNALPAIPTITPTGATTFCLGGSVILTSSASTSYLWSTSATTQAITTGTAATYTVTITDGNGCTRASAGTVVTVNGNPILGSIAPQTNTCPAVDFDLATIVLVNTGTAGASSYHATQADAINNAAPIASLVAATGVYWIRVTTGAGCFDYKGVTVNITSCACVTPPTAAAGGDQSVCAGGTITLAGSIGGSATVGTWTTSGSGAFTPSATTLNAVYTPSVADTVAGSAILTLTTDNPAGAPCVAATDQMIITINGHPTVSVSPSGTSTICSGNSITLTASLNTTYLWSTGATTQSISVNAAGNYTVTVTNAAGCTNVSAAKPVAVNTLPTTPTITPASPISVCAGTTVTLTSSIMAGGTYLWSTGATTQAITAGASGSYRVTVTNAGGCTASSALTSVTINATPATPTVSPSGPTTICQGGLVTLQSSAGSAYLWSNGATAQSVDVTASGTYRVTVTDANGCTASSATMTITVNALPTANVTYSGSTTMCAGATKNLTSSINTSYLWSTGQTTRTITVSTSGTYMVTVTSAAGCTKVSNPVTITVNPAVVVAIIPLTGTVFCQPGSADLSATAGYSYLWSNGATTQISSAFTSGAYTVTASDASGCTGTSSISVTALSQPSAPVVSPASPVSLCSGQSTTLLVSAYSSYLWSTGATTQSIITSTSGTYYVTVTNANGCSNVSAGTVVSVGSSSLNPVITATGSTTVCQGVSVPLTVGTASLYLWSNGKTTQSILATVSGNYRVTVTDAFGCTKSSAIKAVTIKPKPSAVITALGNTTICVGGSVGLSASGGSGYTFKWSNGSTNQKVIAKNTGIYTLTVTGSNGCSAQSMPISVFKTTTCTTACGPIIGIGVDSIKTKQARINWSFEGNNQDSVRICYKQVGKPGSMLCKNCLVDVRYLMIYNLKPTTVYEYYGYGWCNGVKTDSTAALRFTTLPPPH